MQLDDGNLIKKRKYQVCFFNSERELTYYITKPNLRSVKNHLAKKGVVGSASIFDCSLDKVFYYKPKK